MRILLGFRFPFVRSPGRHAAVQVDRRGIASVALAAGKIPAARRRCSGRASRPAARSRPDRSPTSATTRCIHRCSTWSTAGPCSAPPTSATCSAWPTRCSLTTAPPPRAAGRGRHRHGAARPRLPRGPESRCRRRHGTTWCLALVRALLDALQQPETAPARPTVRRPHELRRSVRHRSGDQAVTGSCSHKPDRPRPDSGFNRSVFQRFLHLINDSNHARMCNKDGATVSVDGLPIGSFAACDGFQIDVLFRKSNTASGGPPTTSRACSTTSLDFSASSSAACRGSSRSCRAGTRESAYRPARFCCDLRRRRGGAGRRHDAVGARRVNRRACGRAHRRFT